MLQQVGAIAIAFVMGTLYYYNMSASIPKNVNCSFSANIWTDILAFVAGFILIYLGMTKYNDIVLTMIGTVIVTEHVWQLTEHKL